MIGWPQGLPHIPSEVVAASACEFLELGVGAGNCSNSIKHHSEWLATRQGMHCLAGSISTRPLCTLWPLGSVGMAAVSCRTAATRSASTAMHHRAIALGFTWRRRAEDSKLNCSDMCFSLSAPVHALRDTAEVLTTILNRARQLRRQAGSVLRMQKSTNAARKGSLTETRPWLLSVCRVSSPPAATDRRGAAPKPDNAACMVSCLGTSHTPGCGL